MSLSSVLILPPFHDIITSNKRTRRVKRRFYVKIKSAFRFVLDPRSGGHFLLETAMKKISLTQNQFALVDDEDFEFLNQWKWKAAWNRATNSFYAQRGQRIGKSGTTITMSRLIMSTPKDMDCDHVDHNTLNHQKYNLRNVTHSHNSMNRKGPQKNNKLGILGVSHHRDGFRGIISKDGKQILLPHRKTLEEAIADRKTAEEKYYGEYRNQDKH